MRSGLLILLKRRIWEKYELFSPYFRDSFQRVSPFLIVMVRTRTPSPGLSGTFGFSTFSGLYRLYSSPDAYEAIIPARKTKTGIIALLTMSVPVSHLVFVFEQIPDLDVRPYRDSRSEER